MKAGASLVPGEVFNLGDVGEEIVLVSVFYGQGRPLLVRTFVAANVALINVLAAPRTKVALHIVAEVFSSSL